MLRERDALRIVPIEAPKTAVPFIFEFFADFAPDRTGKSVRLLGINFAKF